FHTKRAAARFVEDAQDKKIAHCLRNTQTRSTGMCIRELTCMTFPCLKCTHDRRATGGLHRKHARTFFPNPTESLHLIERFPHADETGASASWIKNNIGQLPTQLFG